MYKHMGVHTYTYICKNRLKGQYFYIDSLYIMPLVYLTIIEFKIFAWTTTFQGSQQQLAAVENLERLQSSNCLTQLQVKRFNRM